MQIQTTVPHEKYLTPILWLIFFCYAICMALVFQNVVVPNMLSMSDGGRLLSNDAVYFDSVAWSLAQDIRSQGWSSWHLFVSATAPANVSILAALYAIFGHAPSLAIPINASLHAFGGILVFLLAREIATKKSVGIYAGVIAATLFVIFPSALNWYGQIHKDGYAIAGTLLTLLMWIRVLHNPPNIKSWLWIVAGSLVGIILIGIVRPYGLILLLAVTIGAIIIIALSNTHKDLIKQIMFFAVFIIVLVLGILTTKEYTPQASTPQASTPQAKTSSEIDLIWEWEYSSWLPERIENYVAAAARARAGLIYHGKQINAHSTIDDDVVPQNLSEVVSYLPRALHIATMAPFPVTWFSQLSMTRLVAAAEMFIYYLCIPGLILLLRYNRKPAVWMAIYFSVAFLVILGFTVANIGSLFRIRYAYLFVLLMLGVLGWITFLDRKNLIRKIIQILRPKFESPLACSFAEPNSPNSRNKAVGLGLYVSALTFLGFLGFFYRDILMAQYFGLGAELDSFFVALLIPMTIVTILCIPLGSSFTPLFLSMTEKASKKEVQSLISSVSSVVVLFLFVLCVGLYFGLPYILPYVVGETIENIERVQKLTILALPILFFSGLVILGNTILNAMGKVLITSVAQLIVPIIAIAAVIIYGDQYGVFAVMMGMVIGQILNLLIIQAKVKTNNYSLMPKYDSRNSQYISELSSQYFPLIASAFFVSIVLLVNTILAMSLPEGAVSIFNLGSKIVLLVTGLVGAAISTVMLPYFSTLIAKNNIITARRELSIFLLLLTFISIPISVVLFIWAEPIVSLLFEGGDFGTSDVEIVARVMQYAVVQIPFFACNVLLLKYAIATKHVVAILFAAIMGLGINIGASLLLMQHMGVSGIALGASLSIVVSTMVLVIILVRYWHIRLLDMVILLLNWLLFITLLISIHFGSISGSIVSGFSYIVLLFGYSQLLSSDASAERLVS